MRKRSLLLLAGAAAIVASLAVGPAATAGPEKASAGTVVFIHDQEPPSLRPSWTDNSLYATSLVMNNIFLGGQIRDNKSNWVLRNFKSAPKLLKKSPLTISQLSDSQGFSVPHAARSTDTRVARTAGVSPLPGARASTTQSFRTRSEMLLPSFSGFEEGAQRSFQSCAAAA